MKKLLFIICHILLISGCEKSKVFCWECHTYTSLSIMQFDGYYTPNEVTSTVETICNMSFEEKVEYVLHSINSEPYDNIMINDTLYPRYLITHVRCYKIE